MRKNLIAVVTAVMLAATLMTGAPATAKPPKKLPDSYIPKNGPAFNNPYGGPDQVRALIRKVNRTIDSVPRGGKIRIASWNVRSGNIVRALLRAHRRGVSVQVVMDKLNWNPNNPNIDAQRLAEGLKAGNKKRSKERRSFVKRCRSSCRGPHGIAHTKFFLFNKVKGVGRNGEEKIARYVTMYGSYNATELGATIQWNDLMTIKEDKPRYKVFEDVFDQMRRDKIVPQSYVAYDDGVIANQFYPYLGEGAVGDPVMAALKSITCTNAGTPNGRTKIRIAQTSIHGDRGIRIARKLASMRRAGCDIKVAYAMNGGQVTQILRAAGIAQTHLAYDANLDGVYDRYLHAKTMAVHGNIGGVPNSMVTWNGSANWTQVALASDEVLGTVRKVGVTRKYLKWIDKLMVSRPLYWDKGSSAGTATEARTVRMEISAKQYHRNVTETATERGVDPYALIKGEM